jgi:dephospho-CoA kinase
MGKSTTAAMFAALGCAVWDADASVHRLYGQDGAAVPEIAKMHPEAVVDGAVQREKLKLWISEDPTALARIEAAVHPLVAQDRRSFIDTNAGRIVVLDIPLLFENGSEALMDGVVVVSTDPETQKQRVLARNTMNEATFKAILEKQMPDSEKRARADIVIPTKTRDETERCVAEIVERINKGAFHA